MDRFGFDSSYNEDLNFTRIKFGFDRPILESELNEMQLIQNDSRIALSKKIMSSGFIEKVQKNFEGSSIVFNPTDNISIKYNHISIAPFKAFINGYEINGYGDSVYNNNGGYLDINLGEAPEQGFRSDLVYLECWFELAGENDKLTKYGYVKGKDITNTIVDSRVNQETTRRIVFKWDIKVKTGVDFDKYPNGFGFENINSFSSIYATTNNAISNSGNPNLIFANASNKIFKNCNFYGDSNLWVAGRPDYELSFKNIWGKYVFALPMFKVVRRNKSKYSMENINGSLSKKEFNNLNIDSSKNGDIVLGVRPDMYFYDFIEYNDIVDLRKTVLNKKLNNDYYLNNSLNDLFTGKLNKNEKIKRVQFGNKKFEFSNSYIIYINNFNNSYEPMVVNNDSPFYTHIGEDPIYKESLNESALLLNNKTMITTDVGSFNTEKGTIDFFFKPFWQGDSNVNQNIFELKDSNDSIVFKLYKENNKFIFLHKKYSNEHYENNDKIIVDLSNLLIYANNYYHLRLSWASSIMMMYLNGKLINKSIYQKGEMVPSKIVFGEIGEKCEGMLIEKFIMYSNNFETTIFQNGYNNIQNSYWPNLPYDFINYDSILRESFDSITNNVSDNCIVQKNTIGKLDFRKILGDNFEYVLKLPIDKTIDVNTSPKVYDENGTIVLGSWANLEGQYVTFICDKEYEYLIATFDLVLPSGNGGNDLINNILRATITNSTFENKEISFNCKNEKPRKINYLKPRTVNSKEDYAFDFDSNRNVLQCFTRLLYYYLTGNGTNEYIIPGKLYGYDVVGIIGCNNRRILQITKKDNGDFIVLLNQNLNLNDTIEFQLSLGGYSFEYEPQNKTIFSNMLQLKYITLEGDGINTTYNVKCFDDDLNSGIIHSVFNLTNNITNIHGEIVDQENDFCAFIDGLLFHEDANFSSKINSFKLNDECINTPFLKITFDKKPIGGSKIEIPVLVSYQPKPSDEISIWYNHNPYSGLLGTTKTKLKMFSNWKYFITTLSSGKENLDIKNKKLNNIINRLPGGLSYGYLINGSKINLDTFNIEDKDDSNAYLIFTNNVIYGSENKDFDKDFFELDCELEVSKSSNNFQDGIININDKNFKVYFNNCKNNITKYIGMACLVIDENNELMLLILGSTDNFKSSNVNCLKPQYGDLFKINNLPTI